MPEKKLLRAVPQQNQDRSVEENVEIELLLDELLRRDVHDREQVVSERPRPPDQGRQKREEDRLGEDQLAVTLPARAEYWATSAVA